MSSLTFNLQTELSEWFYSGCLPLQPSVEDSFCFLVPGLFVCLFVCFFQISCDLSPVKIHYQLVRLVNETDLLEVGLFVSWRRYNKTVEIGVILCLRRNSFRGNGSRQLVATSCEADNLCNVNLNPSCC